ncbi:uncharacterized protein LOC132273665 isoform X2 [Cornus florida]|uniref:uncharacterized protein LOC132273665 isoform X2 n=1 Tax=Cornus florida TaxID=4283 RepID=UPI002898051F|nr:uncharacterized protein LOC132273665 isoform X2 [Cornus florida]
MMTKTFKGANVFISRNLVPPEIFDSLHDALKHNGAEVFLCSDPSRNGPNDYHIISSNDHEKFDDLRSKGCNLLGPQCVLSCAKEHRALPNQGFTCCLAMDGVKLLASGFEMDEKVEIGRLVTSMGGVLHSKASMDVSFVIVKNVLAAKYKWASNILKKPVVTINWLYQCWKEHRVVPQDLYRVLPFSGLTICVTRIPADERKEMEKIIIENGGKYSAELTKKCSHLVCDAPEGDKYKVAKRWGHIHIVSRKWFDQSVARRACLNEESYPPQGGSGSLINTRKILSTTQNSQDKSIGNLQRAPSSVAADSNLQDVLCAGSADPDLEATLSQNKSSTFSDAPIFTKEDSGAPAMQPKNDTNFDGCVANDSQTEDNDLYLSECRILLVGFDASEMRKLVNMVRRGGGSRHMSLNDKLTHIVVGTPSESEKKEVRRLAALGVIHVVRTTWLEDCDREKKELPVLQRHNAYDSLLPKDTVFSIKGAAVGMAGMKQVKTSSVQSIVPDNQLWENMNSGSEISSEKRKEPEVIMKSISSLKATVVSAKQSQHSVLNGNDKGQQEMQHGSSNEIRDGNSSNVFKGRLFCFSSSFPEDRRAEIVEWVNQGGGEVVDDQIDQNVHFTIECHGVVPSVAGATRSISISSHWIRSCLEDGCLLDVSSHILYSPLPCQIPLPGFKGFRFCVSQYDEKDRLLLRNLCFVLGAKFVEKLTKKVTHLLCKFTSGPKYEAACKWGIQSVTSEWIYDCVKQNEVVSPSSFCPKEVTSKDQEAGFCTMSQYPSQAIRMISGDNASQFPSQSQDPRIQTQGIGSRSDSSREELNHSSIRNKKARLLGDDSQRGLLSCGVNQNDPIWRMSSTENNIAENIEEVSPAIPDVASAIEDLLEQTNSRSEVTRGDCM